MMKITEGKDKEMDGVFGKRVIASACIFYIDMPAISYILSFPTKCKQTD